MRNKARFMMGAALCLLLAGSGRADAGGAQDASILVEAAQGFARDAAALSRWNVHSLEVSERSRAHVGTRLEVTLEVKTQQTLAFASPEDVPLLKGERAWLVRQAGALDAVKRAAAEQELRYWHTQLQEYILTPQDARLELVLSAELDGQGQIRNDSLTISVTDPVGKRQPADEFLGQLGVPESDLLAEGERVMQEVVRAAAPQATTALYNRTNAASYVNKYVANTTKICQSGSSTIQDKSKYNTAYSAITCNDCANYVSQGLKAGGIPTDSTWKAGSSAWISVTSLKNYMVGTKGYWKSISCSAAKNGDVITLSSSGSYYHTMMVVGNNGTSTLTYSAHTNDRLKYTIGYSYSGIACWQVVY